MPDKPANGKLADIVMASFVSGLKFSKNPEWDKPIKLSVFVRVAISESIEEKSFMEFGKCKYCFDIHKNMNTPRDFYNAYAKLYQLD